MRTKKTPMNVMALIRKSKPWAVTWYALWTYYVFKRVESRRTFRAIVLAYSGRLHMRLE